MNVHPQFTTHLKFKLFKLRLGDAAAAEYILRLWAHCQVDQRGENWGDVSPEFVEGVADWRGQPGKLYTELLHPFEKKPGWIHRNAEGETIITEWNEHNLSLLKAWCANSPNLRKRFQSVLEMHGKSHPKTNGESTPTSSPKTPPIRSDQIKEDQSTKDQIKTGSGSDLSSQIPSVEEVKAWAAAADVAPAYAVEKHAELTGKAGWFDDNSKLIPWQRRWLKFWATDRTEWEQKKAAAQKMPGDSDTWWTDELDDGRAAP